MTPAQKRMLEVLMASGRLQVRAGLKEPRQVYRVYGPGRQYDPFIVNTLIGSGAIEFVNLGEIAISDAGRAALAGTQ